MVDKLSDDDIHSRLRDLPGWSLHDGKLCREFHFANFVDAFGFMTRAAILVEKANHHPEWSNVYNKVMVQLVTHECDGISERDFDLAEMLDELAP